MLQSLALILAALLPVDRCDVSVVREFTLADAAGREIYVEPTTVLSSQGKVLLAGSPQYVTRPTTSTRWGIDTIPGLLGVILTPGDSVVYVQSSFVSPPTGVLHGTAARGGGWWLLLGDASFGNHERADPSEFLLARVSGDGSVSKLLPLAGPPGYQVQEIGSSTLVQVGDVLYWAAIGFSALGRSEVIVFSLDQSAEWKWRTIPVSVGSAVLTPNSKDKLLLAVLQGDPSQRGDGYSIVIYDLLAPSLSPQIIARSGTNPVHHPAVSWDGEDLLISWVRQIDSAPRNRRQLETTTRAGNGAIASARTVDSAVAQAVRVPVAGSANSWVVLQSEAVGPAREGDYWPQTKSDIVFMSEVNDSAEKHKLLTTTTLRGVIGATSNGVDQATVTLPYFTVADSVPSLTTRVVRARIVCSQEQDHVRPSDGL